MNSRTTRTAIVLVALALLATGCGSDPDDDPQTGTIAQTESGSASEVESEAEVEIEAEVAPPEVAETGFGVGEYGNAVIVSVIKNPSDTHGGSVTVSGTAYDASGQVLGTSSGSTILRSQEEAATADFLSIPEGAEVDRVTVQAAFNETETDEHPESRITARNVQVVDDGYGTFRANGEVVSTYESDLKDVMATAVCRDEAGAINGGGFTFVDLLPGGGTSGVSIDVTAANKPARCDVYANISILSVLAS